jgi:hypothetical protein
MTTDVDEFDVVYDGPDARWPEVPAWQVYLAVGITALVILVLYALTKAGAFRG